ncbi:hypothetical protein AB1Y20_014573 [Prymnesium parvum]|uniref:N-acetyltransferase domain-containing protein n=1 Tax=Prymnesium parvum TaxID=97485 RepID=A0AB34IAY3_PRYPA
MRDVRLAALTPLRPWRSGVAGPRCVVDIRECFPSGSLPSELQCFGSSHRLVLPEEDDVADIASLITLCFYEDADTRTGAPEVPEFARAELRDAVPAAFKLSSPELQERWRSAYNGLHARCAARLRRPHLKASLDSTLVLALQECLQGRSTLTCCCELSLRPVDGRLPGELLPPRPLQIGFAPPSPPSYGAYLANLGVRPSHRRRGLARKMLRASEWVVRESWGLRDLHLHVDLHNGAAATLYHDMDYEELPSYDDMCKPAGPTYSARPVHYRYHRKRLQTASKLSTSMRSVIAPSRPDMALEQGSATR